MPVIEGEGKSVRVIAGSLFGKRSPVNTCSALFYADATMHPGASLTLDTEYHERAIYLVDGTVEVAGQSFEVGKLLVFSAAEKIVVKAVSAVRLLLLGGEPLDGPRYLWWNFVSSSRERIEQAKADWKAGRFAAVPGDSEFTPLPEG